MIGDKIKAARLAEGLTQKQLAEKVGVPYRSVQRWEKGNYKPNYDNLVKLAAALNKSIDSFSEETGG